ncbi:phage tail sheath subtilisin-like domain-containing protein [Chromohalobacter israelensis]|uniref:phage tail sheath subtilisin-like domain-containing protein n=1 Tax=Chromohalobacter israelensis TaxID=141390 RepID=UPI000FFF3BC6|nr:phage tail sheath subtilisin-like domain-containing protein [Chromohalobacter salexigens]RXE49214.1 phage tail protein [Chromohalobacter salexigens]
MAIASGVYNDIPSDVRIPGVFIEFDARLANSGVWQTKLLIIGQRLAGGEKDALSVDRVTSGEVGDRYYGRGSMLAEMLRASLDIDPYQETYAVALDDLEAGTKAKGSITVSGTAERGGTMALYIAGYRVRVGVETGDTADTIAQALVDAIGDESRLPVTAQVNGTTPETLDIECKWAGETGNDIHLVFNAKGERGIDGVAVEITQPSGGDGNPDIGEAIATLGDTWFNYIAMPYTDTANLDELAIELDRRYGPMVQMGSRAFAAYRGTHSETGTFGATLNSPHLTVMGTGPAVSPTWLWATTYAVVAASALTNDPARPLQYLSLPGLIGPRKSDEWAKPERNLLLYDGIATFTVADDGTVQINREITTYQVNDAGVESDAYLDIQTPETLERIRYEQISRILSKYPRHKLAEDADADLYGAGQPIMTPNVAKAEFLDMYRDFMERGWVQDYDGYAESMSASIDPDNPARLNMIDSPKLVGQYRIHATQTQFRR